MATEPAPIADFNERFFIDVPQHFYQRFEGEVTAAMLADSLIGLDGMVRHTADFLERYLDVRIRGSETLVTSVQFGSLEETLLFRFFFGKGRVGAKKFEEFRAAVGIKNMEAKHLVGLALSAVALFGVGYWMRGRANAPTTIHIENSFNNISEGLQLSHEELLALLKATIKDPEELKRNTVRMVNPDGKRHGGEIVINGEEQTTLPKEVLEVVPEKYEKEVADEPVKIFPKSDVSIRAMDLDKPERGWWAIAPEITDRRLPILLEPGIDPLSIPYGKLIKADLLLTYKVDRHGNRSPKGLVLKRLLRDAPPAMAGE